MRINNCRKERSFNHQTSSLSQQYNKHPMPIPCTGDRARVCTQTRQHKVLPCGREKVRELMSISSSHKNVGKFRSKTCRIRLCPLCPKDAGARSTTSKTDVRLASDCADALPRTLEIFATTPLPTAKIGIPVAWTGSSRWSVDRPRDDCRYFDHPPRRDVEDAAAPPEYQCLPGRLPGMHHRAWKRRGAVTPHAFPRFAA